jgi:hypothetical protein
LGYFISSESSNGILSIITLLLDSFISSTSCPSEIKFLRVLLNQFLLSDEYFFQIADIISFVFSSNKYRKISPVSSLLLSIEPVPKLG